MVMTSNKSSIDCKGCNEAFDVLWENREVEYVGSDDRCIGTELT